jgi:2-polyprenyl-3-methyl-5-hydroxy-6-metoxy-1,4-benzoquinol methylase
MKEYDIRPQKLFNEFLEVARSDINKYFSNVSKFIEVDCPGCGHNKSEESFSKHEMHYRECVNCGSLFMSPRPTSDMIDSYYKNSASSKFWAERFFPETMEARREMIFKPRAQIISNILQKMKNPKPWSLADIGSGYGLFLQELAKLNVFHRIIAIEPSKELADTCRSKGFDVLQNTLEELTNEDLKVSFLTSFEVIEHLFSPVEFLSAANRLLERGGHIVFTTLTASGWDIQTLWEKSKSVSPPHHINLLTTEGLEYMVKRAGFEVVEISTPGKLDVDIVKNMMDEDNSMIDNKFVNYLIKKRDLNAQEAFQKFLQQNKLSSHAQVIARKL